jgi:cellulose synthase/poly-beta-1,6-N-acetylglucosamine synthase-like glycosyltransferase
MFKLKIIAFFVSTKKNKNKQELKTVFFLHPQINFFQLFFILSRYLVYLYEFPFFPHSFKNREKKTLLLIIKLLIKTEKKNKI